jgi:hypothetical protein
MDGCGGPRSGEGFSSIEGRADMPKLVAALRARDQELGFISRESVEEVA